MDLVAGDWAYVGDTCVDQMAAEAAGVPFFVVPWGGGPNVDVSQTQRLSRLADLLQQGAIVHAAR
jgi:phosphoglycolate phosphatase